MLLDVVLLAAPKSSRLFREYAASRTDFSKEPPVVWG